MVFVNVHDGTSILDVGMSHVPTFQSDNRNVLPTIRLGLLYVDGNVLFRLHKQWS